MLLSIITFGLVAISMFGMYYLTTSQEIHNSDVSRYWTETSIGVFLGIVVTTSTEHFNYKQEIIRVELFACLLLFALSTGRLFRCKVNELLT